MEKDLFELMTKMYGEMQVGFSSVNNRLDNLETKVDNLETKVDNLETKVNILETEVKKTNIIIENDIKPSLSALFDGYKQNSESITRLTDDVKDLTIAVNSLTIKTLQNENNIISFSKRMDTLSTSKH